MDVYDLKKKHGNKISLSGNIDIAGPLAFDTLEESTVEVQENLDKLLPKGGYIMSINTV